jgi:hypothetical protein
MVEQDGVDSICVTAHHAVSAVGMAGIGSARLGHVPFDDFALFAHVLTSAQVTLKHAPDHFISYELVIIGIDLGRSVFVIALCAAHDLIMGADQFQVNRSATLEITLELHFRGI